MLSEKLGKKPLGAGVERIIILRRNLHKMQENVQDIGVDSM
jgi:hypothetical protein